MTNIFVRTFGPMLAALCLASSLPSRAAVIYDNSAHDLNTRFNPGTNEVGDEIILAGTERFLTNFSFEFYGTNTASAFSFSGTNVEARIRFYLNDGTAFNGYSTPGSVFYDSGFFAVPAPTSRSTFIFTSGTDFPYAGLFMPVGSNMTWSVQFMGMGPTDELGVDLFDPVAVGGNHPDYWENDSGIWTLKTNAVPMNFAARMEATVPEPSIVALTILSAVVLLAARRKPRVERPGQ